MLSAVKIVFYQSDIRETCNVVFACETSFLMSRTKHVSNKTQYYCFAKFRRHNLTSFLSGCRCG